MKSLIASLAALAIASPAFAQGMSSTSTTTTTPATTTTTTVHKVSRHRPMRHHRRVIRRHKHVTHIKAKVTETTTK